MSSFSQFFGAAISSVGGNIFSSIKPPKMSALGNTLNLDSGSHIAETFKMPGTTNIVGFNLSSTQTIQAATWANTALWAYNASSSGNICDFIYNPVLNKYYLAKVTGATVYEVNPDTGTLTQVGAAGAAPDLFTFYTSFSAARCSRTSVDASGYYTWRNPSTKVGYRYNQSFVKIQSRSLVSGVASDSYDWYYSRDTGIRCRSVITYASSGSSPVNIYSAVPLLIIERFGSRRIIQVSAVDIFSARFRNDINPVTSSALTSVQNQTMSICPMAPLGETNIDANGCYFGDSVRLGAVARGDSYAADSFLLDRDDYDRWLSDVADALGMPVTQNFYGAWTNV